MCAATCLCNLRERTHTCIGTALHLRCGLKHHVLISQHVLAIAPACNVMVQVHATVRMQQEQPQHVAPAQGGALSVRWSALHLV